LWQVQAAIAEGGKHMRMFIDAVLIAGFVILDWLRFHDIFKPETPTLADWLTGALSILVFYVAVESLISGLGTRTSETK
jgi:hypothetical protein